MWEKMTTEKNSKVVGSVIMERKMEQLLLPLLSLCVCVCVFCFLFVFFLSGRSNIFNSWIAQERIVDMM